MNPTYDKLTWYLRVKWNDPENPLLFEPLKPIYQQQVEQHKKFHAQKPPECQIYTFKMFWDDYRDGWPNFETAREISRIITETWNNLDEKKKESFILSHICHLDFHFGQFLDFMIHEKYVFTEMQKEQLLEMIERIKLAVGQPSTYEDLPREERHKAIARKFKERMAKFDVQETKHEPDAP